MASKKKSARRRGRPSGPGPNKSDFIRQHPNLSPSEVVAKAKEHGISMSSALVYNVRGRTNPKRRSKPSGKPGPAPKNGKTTASDFIRSQPRTMKAKDVIDAATKAGFKKFGANLVYLVRSKMTSSGTTASPRTRRQQRATSGSTANVSTFKKMALDLGIARARQALDELERGLAALLG